VLDLPPDWRDWPVRLRHTFRARAAHLRTLEGYSEEDAEREAREFTLRLFRETEQRERT
jgi:hypothetical protein